jgi:CRP-like cAMP-binding protein
VLAMAITRKSFLKLVADDSDLAVGLLKALSIRLRQADEAAAR